jgi:hypothetical protein
MYRPNGAKLPRRNLMAYERLGNIPLYGYHSIMRWIERIISAIRDGRVISSARSHWVAIESTLRERRLRGRIDLPAESGGPLPVISRRGDFTASDESLLVKHSFDRALNDESPLPSEIRDIDGMSGQKYRAFINNLVRSCPNPRYLEVGCWTGSTATAALNGNRASVLCIDNWSQFGGPKDQFFQNIKKVLSEKIQFKFMERDFRSVDYGSIGRFNIYLFDGPHEEADQYDGVMLPQPALTGTFVLIVDDWNWRDVRLGTFRALAASRCQLECSIEVRTTLDESHASVSGKQSDWHNGYFIAVVRKPAGGAAGASSHALGGGPPWLMEAPGAHS